MRVSVVLLFILALSGAAATEPLPPLGTGESYMVFPGGSCQGMIEIGTYKPELDQVWTKSPRQFVEICTVIPVNTWVGRYRLAARCVDRNTKTAISGWVRARSALNQPWPAECTQYTPGAPQTGTPP